MIRLSIIVVIVGIGFGADRGRDLFETGSTPGHDAIAILRGNETEVPARLMACANCHGIHAEGKTEAGVTAPPLTGDLSFDAFERIVRDGVGREGKPLHPAMPSYRFSREELTDLWEHLLQLNGRVLSHGVTSDEIRIGMATGPNAQASAAVQQVVRAAFEGINAEGGIFRRKLVLETRPRHAGLKGATFAVIASLGDDDWNAAAQPVIGPLSAAAAGPNVYTLLPSATEQWSALCGYLAKNTPHGVRIVPEDQQQFVAAAPACRVLRMKAGAAPTILFAGREADLERVILANPGRQVATLHVVAGRSAFRLPEEARGRLLIAYPAVPADQVDLAAVETAAAGRPEFPALQSMALGSARVLIEALKRAGRDLTQSRLEAALESLNGFETGLIPPVTFGSGKQSGVRGAYLVRASADRFIPLGSWITAEE